MATIDIVRDVLVENLDLDPEAIVETATVEDLGIDSLDMVCLLYTSPQTAEALYEYFVECVRQSLGTVQTGSFGAMMEVALVNDGPFTIWLDTDQLF